MNINWLSSKSICGHFTKAEHKEAVIHVSLKRFSISKDYSMTQRNDRTLAKVTDTEEKYEIATRKSISA